MSSGCWKSSVFSPILVGQRSVHRRAKRVHPPPNPIANKQTTFNAREYLKTQEKDRFEAQDHFQKEHGYLNDPVEEKEFEKAEGESYEKVLKSHGFSKIQRVHPWDKKSQDLK